MMKMMKIYAAVSLLLLSSATAFSPLKTTTTSRSCTSVKAARDPELFPVEDEGASCIGRRSLLQASVAMATTLVSAAASASAVQEPETRQGIPVTAFNGLIFNYRGSQYGGLEANELNEPSVSYKEFCERLSKGEVEFVEFLAPDGDAAYVTFKGDTGGPIRIGEGYPIEQHDGWSSPAFAVRTVKNAGVPYKFTVPALAKYSTK